MSQLSQIFGTTIGSRTNKPQGRQSEAPDALLEAYLPETSDSVDLRSVPQSSGQSFGFAQLQGQAGLPRLSNVYSSNTGGLLDVTG
ncbi:MAG: hypothetical protein WC314_14890 [Vulcanimicrobiota bacterium]